MVAKRVESKDAVKKVPVKIESDGVDTAATDVVDLATIESEGPDKGSKKSEATKKKS